MKGIADQLIDLSAHVVSLQEAWLETDRALLMAELEDSRLAYNCYYPSAWLGSGLMIISQYPIVKTDFMPYRLNGRPQEITRGDYYGGKGVAFARLATPDGLVDVYNTHTIAQYGTDEEDAYLAHRMAQLYEFTEFIHKNSVGYPVIATGDYNVRPDQFGYELITGLGGLTDVVAALDREPAFTYSADNAYVGPDAVPRRIDYVLVQGFSACQAEVVMKPTDDSHGFSDHFGVLAELKTTQLPPAEIPANTAKPLLARLLRILNAGLETAEDKRSVHWGFTGLGAISFVGAQALASKIQTRREFLKSVVHIGGAAVTLSYLLANGWLSAIVLPDEIQDLARIQEEVQRQYDALAPQAGGDWLMNAFQQQIDVETIYYKEPAGGYEEATIAPGRIRILNWNIERGYDPQAISDYIKARKPDIVCLQELDWNNKRTDYVDVLQVIADQTGLLGLFATEFIEIDTPDRRPRDAGGGVHGNAILTRYKPLDVTRVELPITFDWQDPPSDRRAIARREKRVGGRIAICAQFALGDRHLLVSSAHLEDKAGGVEGRFRQFSYLVNLIEQRTQEGDISVIAGDLNTLQNWLTGLIGYEDASRSLGKPWHRPECQWWKETLLPDTGYTDPFSCSDWTIAHDPVYREKLDWILCRGAEITAGHIGGFNTSDHRPLEAFLEIA